ncbi:fungal-specific transcription factor domain-containing protein [Xylaria bambusicola]|uniref:fungal-specific transcription factor domain-containing protein n=1 Tax=Xylaria bambusicola TaxID=326684 RepID=UPI002007EA8A|nr:fungal-specific transcription factor domain-containing protein [Xylaria bambusicola]KAI0521341.1 fungal-specific transcription factor domain-containing protein [Xylaria bambusicola]
MRPPMRSSIACTRCRKSKIKCENKNGETPCESCIKTGSQCIFKVPDPAPPKRSEPPAIVKQERDGGSDRKRLKKIDDIAKDDGQRAMAHAEDVLSAPFLTEDLWHQVLDLYKIHFGPELSFLYLPTIKEKLGRRSKALHSEHSLDSNLVLLGILTLTARFHPDLVRYTAHLCNNQSGNTKPRPPPSQPDPSAASDYYADVLAMALGPVQTMMDTASIDRVAALLMLGLYAWSQTQPKTGGMKAWMYVGTAIRMAQFLGLAVEGGEIGDPRIRGAADLRLMKDINCKSQLALQKEIRRRIMFSCFILDRMLACGKYRISIIRGDDLHIQLPCSEQMFDLAIEVQTSRLGQLERGGNHDNVLSRFIQLVDLWGEISKYSFRGGRVEDKYPPWHAESDFYSLMKALERFDSTLPSIFTFSRLNFFRHENHQALSTYVLLHMLRFVCLIMLHREYVPFVPIRCREPEGPLDHPTFTREETPAGFWRTSAEQLFKAARGIVDLTEICQKKDKLPQSTIVLFGIWTASFVGLYGAHFPQMDTERHMLSFDYEDTGEDVLKDIFSRGPTALAFQTLLKMATWQKMASTYVEIFHGMNDYFSTIKQDYCRYSDQNGRPNNATLRVREGGTGGGLEEYRPLGAALKDFGTIQPSEHDVVDISERLRIRDVEKGGSIRSAPPASFTAINHSSSPTSEPTRPFSQAQAIARIETPQVHSEPHVESRRYPNVSWHQPHSSPAQTYPTPGSMLDPEPTHTPAFEQSVMNDSEEFWEKLARGELHRFGATGDLSLFSTGYPEIPITGMPFGGPLYFP